MSDTPETDAARITEIKSGVIATFQATEIVTVHFARRLERERDKWKTKAILHGNVALDMEQDINKIRAINVELLGALKPLTKLWDRFCSNDITYENAYYTFYKGESSAWEAAKNAIRKAKEGK